ncbi:MAG: hypothetical protein WEB52_04080 [Dehalococcoidia bacterium]
MDPQVYQQLAEDGIQELLAREHAVAWLEVEAKLAETPTQNAPRGLNPHHLLNAKRALLERDVLKEITEPTRGGQVIPIIVPADTKRGERAVHDAAARKRLLMARYLSWSAAQGKVPNLIGVAGERVCHASLMEAAPAGYVLLKPKGGEIVSLFNREVPGGALDDAAHLLLTDDSGKPIGTATVLVEVKNLRHWIYPESAELYQLLDKSARLQLANPDVRFVPVLALRRAHYTTFRMAKDLGFFIAQARAQFILPRSEVTPEALNEVRTELGFLDLERREASYPTLTRAFSTSIMAVAVTASNKFKAAAELTEHFRELRMQKDTNMRHESMDRLREAAATIQGVKGGW